jgi:hypothetical protein
VHGLGNPCVGANEPNRYQLPPSFPFSIDNYTTPSFCHWHHNILPLCLGHSCDMSSLTIALALGLSHSISISHTHTRTQSLTLRLVFILARPTAHTNKLTLMLSTGSHTQLDTSHLFDNRPHIAVARSIWPIIPCAHVHTHLHLFPLISTRSIVRIVPRTHVITVVHLVCECCHIFPCLNVMQLKEGKAVLGFCWCLVVLVIFFVISFDSSPYFIPICLHSPVTFGYPVIPLVVLF